MKALHLLGFRGAGKTTLGRRLVAELGARFLDLDQLWEERHGRSIVGWVAEHGITAFRETEAALFAEVDAEVRSRPEASVVALGGGIVDHPASRTLLAQSPVPKIYLEVPATELWERLRGSPERLQIGALSTPAALAELLARRAPYFEKIASRTVKNHDINESLREIKKLLASLWQPAP